jgi:hypothetical protein
MAQPPYWQVVVSTQPFPKSTPQGPFGVRQHPTPLDTPAQNAGLQLPTMTSGQAGVAVTQFPAEHSVLGHTTLPSGHGMQSGVGQSLGDAHPCATPPAGAPPLGAPLEPLLPPDADRPPPPVTVGLSTRPPQAVASANVNAKDLKDCKEPPAQGL